MRIVVALVAAFAADVWRAPLLVALHDHSLVTLATALRFVVVVAGVTTAIGVFTTASATVLTVALFAVLGLVQQQGTPIHVHHLVWLSALVAVGHTGRAFSVDAWRRRRVAAAAVESTGNDDDDDRNSHVVHAAAIVLAVVYFWPGVHKLIDAGSPFFDGEALARLVRLKSLEAHRPVLFNLDRAPSLLLLGGWLVMLGELLVVPLAWWRPRLAGVVVVLLHLAFTFVLHMPYTVLAIFAVVFFLVQKQPQQARFDRVVVVAAVIVVGASVAGAAGRMRGWPFACYPTFAVPVPETIDELRLEAISGTVVVDVTTALVPDDLRTPLTFAGRRVRTREQAVRYLKRRLADPAFRDVVVDADLLRVTTVRVALSERLPVVSRRVLLEQRPESD